jgi:hypothetical protein
MNRKAFIAVSVAIAASACTKSDKGSSDSASMTTAAQESTSAEAPSAGACSIASKEEMSAAIGSAVTETEEISVRHCIFRTAAPLVYADVEIDRENADAAWQGINAGDSLIGAQQDSLKGIGDKAFFGPRDRLYLRKGNAFAAIEGGFDDHARDRAIRIARLVSDKL